MLSTDSRDADRQLTTFPVAFPDEQEVTVNQVFSSLLKTVKAKFTTPAPNVVEPSVTLSVAQADDGGPRKEGRGSRSGSQGDVGRGRNTARGEGRVDKPHPLRMAHSNLSEDSGLLPFPKNGGGSSVRSSSQKPSTIGGAPRSTLTSRAPAPPLVSVTPVIRSRDFASPQEDPRPRSRTGPHTHVKNTSITSLTRPRRPSFSGISLSPSTTSISGFGGPEPALDFTNVPGFSIADDARSLRTVASVKRTGSVSKIIRRLRGEGLSKNYWMADENCHECYDCKSVFSTWRRKHHCRICGQIFCSRCAPNIIKGVRFGHEGMVRVCNLCLEIMDECDDDDDKRSITSNTTSHFPNSAGGHMYDGGIGIGFGQPYGQSPFAASQLFSRSGLAHENLNAISEAGWTRRNSFDEDQSQIGTPSENDFDGGRGRERFMAPRHPLLENRNSSRAEAAPFRRGIAEEDREQETGPHPTTANSMETGVDAGLGVATSAIDDHDGQPRARTAGQDKPVVPSIAYTPVTAVGEHASVAKGATDFQQDNNADEPSEAQKSLNSSPFGMGDATGHPGPGALRSRLSSRLSASALSGVLLGEAGGSGVWRSRSDSLAFQPDMLQGPSMQYFRKVLHQAIAREHISNADEWEAVLARLLLKVSTHVSPNIRGGDSMDVRKYVKIKKIPGGRIDQSEYVEGTVITKNVAHKQMARHMINPRIMVLTFPLDYHRVENQFMSLEPLLRQERNYLKHLTKRVIDVRPHIVLVERSVSRLALDFLLDAKISVARGVKQSATLQVARCTQADVIASMDRLALEPRLGRCTEFRIQTFEHPMIPGFRKTYMRFEGCPPEFGCTIIIRGADLETLQKVKRITDFLALAVTNLKLETCMFYDEFNILPPDASANRPPMFAADLDTSRLNSQGISTSISGPNSPPLSKDRQDARDEADRVTAKIRKSLEPYLSTALSISAAVCYDPPAPLAKMGHLDDRLRALRNARDDAEAAAILLEETQERTPETELLSPRISESSSTSDSAQSASTSPQEDSTMASSVSTQRSSGFLTRQRPKESKQPLRQPEEIRSQSAIAQTEYEHAEQLRLWAWYINRNPMDVRPENFQSLTYLSALVCEGQDKPCTGPSLETRNFYMQDDCTLGQYIEGLAAKAAHVCPNKVCTRLQLHHFQVLVHGNTRLQIAIDQFPCPSPGNEEQIITWSYCKICKEASPTAILKEQTWKYSWAKYLEQAFYPPKARGGFACPHDIYRDQIRYFGHRHLAIRIHNELIDVYDVIRPTVALQIRQETRVILKNQEYEAITSKAAAFFDSVVVRLRSFDSSMVPPEKVETLRSALDAMGFKAEEHRQELVDYLDKNYRLTPITDILALNVVYQALQDKVVQWDTDFQDIEKEYLPTEKDIRRMTATHLKKLFANQDMFGVMERNISGMTVSEVDETESQPEEPPLALDISAPDTPCPESQLEPPENPTLLTLPEASSSGQEGHHDEDDLLTPCAEYTRHLVAPSKKTDEEERNYDSDSTISALPRASPGAESHLAKAKEGDSEAGQHTDSDINAFISRLPKRSKPSPTVADLVRRFQSHSPSGSHGSNSPEASLPFHFSRRNPPSDSEQESIFRPKLRRGRTEGTAGKNAGKTKLPLRASSVFSDGDGSYAANASRIPIQSIAGKRPPHSRSRQSGQRASSPSPTRRSTTRKQSPQVEQCEPFIPSPAPIRHTKASLGHALKHLGDIRKMGKGKAPIRSFLEDELDSSRPPSTSGSRSGHKRSFLTIGNKVNSIARHFDRISKDAERDRQKRMSIARGKRARPVGPTKAKVEVFSNVRDAFKDESDSDSSNADDEDDDDGDGDESGREAVEDQLQDALIDEGSSEIEPSSSSTTPLPELEPQPPVGHIDVPRRGTGDSNKLTPLFEPSSLPKSEAGTDVSFHDRLQITLPPFDTTTPLLTVPPTPLLNAAADPTASQFSESEQSSGGPERSSILKTLSGLWAFRTGDFTPLEYPLSAAEHVFADSRIIIREDEPTSIISFTLASRPYRDKLRSIAHQQRTARKMENFMPETGQLDREASSWDVVSLDEVADYDDPLRRDGGTHLKYDFESGNSTIFCRIFFAEQFAALRSACGCEDSFLDSLARCIKWDSSGGKSGSAFLKTKDDRFIAKEVSRLEMDALTKFAPSYFEYMRQSLSLNRPTALAKIYGFFKIGYRNATTGRSMRMNVLVMENLFYERRFERIYDLKGSTRNRLVQPTGRENEVLLDENLMEICNRQPLYLRDHTNKILRTALWNDTLFLASLNVMDYSLVVGVDAEKKELVVGVVDYIRTFTWDKKLESWVKDLGGAGRGEPTIVTPKQYKVRFRNAMEKYFPAVPDIWTRRGNDEAVPDDDVAHSI